MNNYKQKYFKYKKKYLQLVGGVNMERNTVVETATDISINCNKLTLYVILKYLCITDNFINDSQTRILQELVSKFNDRIINYIVTYDLADVNNYKFLDFLFIYLNLTTNDTYTGLFGSDVKNICVEPSNITINFTSYNSSLHYDNSSELFRFMTISNATINEICEPLKAHILEHNNFPIISCNESRSNLMRNNNVSRPISSVRSDQSHSTRPRVAISFLNNLLRNNT